MTVEIRIAAAYLVIRDDLPTGVGDAIEHLEIVVRTSWTTMKQQQRCFLRCFAHYPVVGLISHKGHIALSDFVVHGLFHDLLPDATIAHADDVDTLLSCSDLLAVEGKTGTLACTCRSIALNT